MRAKIVVPGIVLTILGAALPVLFFLTDTVGRIMSLMTLIFIAGTITLCGLVLLTLGIVRGSKSRIAMIDGSQATSVTLCPQCGQQIPSGKGKTRCPYCRQKISLPNTRDFPWVKRRRHVDPSQQTAFNQEMQRFCTHCGASLHPVSIFCQRCGRERRI